MILVVSPHLDDAALGLGDRLGQWEQPLTIATLFAGVPPSSRGTPFCSSYDTESGFTSSHEAMKARRLEDVKAAKVLGAEVVHGPFLESSYRVMPLTPAELAAWLEPLVKQLRPAELIGPLGLHHSDHLLAAEAVRLLLLVEHEVTGLAYEELPYRVQFPEEVPRALDRWRWAAFEPRFDEPAPGSESGSKRKEAALRLYKSQRWALDWHASLCPERLWRLR